MPPWHPVIVDQVPEDPVEDLHYVIVPMPDNPDQWMKDNVPNPSAYVAVMFVPTYLLDIDQVRRDCREFEYSSIGAFETFPTKYRLSGQSTMLNLAFNIVIPISEPL